ncbi:MAG: manganese efflux pump MntP family protein [Blastocatellia bacterium]|nr:manganese efflux pump MntP family protein [Blastocatellia bacterium]
MELTILFLAFGLAMDAVAVSISCAISHKQDSWREIATLPFAFGTFQALMPLLGWLLGLGFRDFLSTFAHWIAFLMLVLIGGKMIKESRETESDPESEKKSLSLPMVLSLAVATSLDAMVVGLSFSFLKVPILFPALVIGIITFVLSLGGVYIGKTFGKHFEQQAELLGGLILIAIGLKILIFH